MKRIDKMTAEQVANFFADMPGCDFCPVFDKDKKRCKTNDSCEKSLRDYLLQDVPMKKRFQTYDNMRNAYPEFKSFCAENHCATCRLKERSNDSCFVCWLDEEVEDEK